ncbi:uncharacterized protein LOC119660476 isoform X2 [Hermetia illucens]|nr:uncharacterized protein LOC119660476 isoform X2 [Hermetia illucens]
MKILQKGFGESALSEARVYEWFRTPIHVKHRKYTKLQSNCICLHLVTCSSIWNNGKEWILLLRHPVSTSRGDQENKSIVLLCFYDLLNKHIFYKVCTTSPILLLEF